MGPSVRGLGSRHPLGRRLRTLPWRLAAAGAGLVVLMVGVVALSSPVPRSRLSLYAGSAWLASPVPGLVTLLDGPSQRAVVSLALGKMSPSGVRVLQEGSASALVADAGAGTVWRVDGGEQQVGPPVAFSHGPGLQVYAGGGRTYVLDAVRRQVALVDPVTLRVHRRVATPVLPGPGQGAVDDQGRLWLVDRESGRLWGTDGIGGISSAAGSPGARLAVVRGRAAILLPAQQSAGWIDGNGGVDVHGCWHGRPSDEIEPLGSSSAARAYAVVPAAGILLGADVQRGACADPVAVGDPGDSFGPPVEAHGYVLVPDRTQGTAAVVDASSGRLVTRLHVLPAGRRLELVVHHGLVFYNDLSGSAAGVITFAGGQWDVGAPAIKYGDGGPPMGGGGQAGPTPAAPAAAASTGGGSDGGKGAGQGTVSPSPPSGRVSGGAPPPVGRNGRGIPPGGTPVGNSSGPTNGGPASGPTGPTSGPTQQGPPTSGPPAGGSLVDRTLTLQVVGPGRVDVVAPSASSCGADATCPLTFPAGTVVQLRATNPAGGTGLQSLTGCGSPDLTSDPVDCSVTLDANASVTATYGTGPSGPPPVTLTVQVSGNGTVAMSTGPCCTAQVPPGTTVTLTANPGPDSAVKAWHGAAGSCGTSTACSVTVDVDTTVGVTFGPATGVVNLGVSGSGSGSVSYSDPFASGSCPSACNPSFPVLDRVTFSAVAATGSSFVQWDSCPQPSGSSCTVDVDPAGASAIAQFQIVDTTGPQVTVTANGGSSSTHAQSFPVTANATDQQSPVVSTEIWVSTSWSCTNGNTGQNHQGSAGAPSATSAGGSVSYTVSVAQLNCGVGWTLAGATFDISGRATSGGGTAWSNGVTVTYTP